MSELVSLMSENMRSRIFGGRVSRVGCVVDFGLPPPS